MAFLRKARAVLVMPGATGNLAWEISWLHHEGLLQKLMVVMPPGLRSRRQKIWRSFCYTTKFDQLVQMPSENDVINSLLLYIDGGNLIVVHGRRTAEGYYKALSKLVGELNSRMDIRSAVGASEGSTDSGQSSMSVSAFPSALEDREKYRRVDSGGASRHGTNEPS